MPTVKLAGHAVRHIRYAFTKLAPTNVSWAGRQLLMAQRYRILNLTLPRLAAEREALAFDLAQLQKRLRSLGGAHLSSEAKVKACFFCKTNINDNACVCLQCKRVQPAAYQQLADIDLSIRKENDLAKEVDVSSLGIMSECAYCISPLDKSASICPICARIQPRKIAVVLSEDTKAISTMSNAS